MPPYTVRNADGSKSVVWKTKKNLFYNLVSDWMQYFNLGRVSLGGTNGLIEVNINEHNLADVGFGVSQALPIIVQGLYMDKDQSLLLEQPEIHLHPEMQLQMADFLIALAKNEKNVIVETHSDHIINRIVRRMMEDTTINRKAKIYFVDQNNQGISTIENITVDPIKGVLSNNENFFTQFASETEKIIRTGFLNKHKEG